MTARIALDVLREIRTELINAQGSANTSRVTRKQLRELEAVRFAIRLAKQFISRQSGKR